MIYECNFKITDEEFKQKKELEIEKKDKSKGEQMPKANDNKQTKARDYEDEQNQGSKEGRHQGQTVQQKEEEWQTQKRKNNKQHEEKNQKAVWRPTSPQNRKNIQPTGITNNSNHNSFTNLSMQEVQQEDREEPTRNMRTQTQAAKDSTAGAPTDDRFRPLDPATGMSMHDIHTTIQESTSDSSYNSSQVREETIHTALEQELDGTSTNISMEDLHQFLDTRIPTQQENFTVPSVRNLQATAAENLGYGGHPTERLGNFHGGITGNDNSGESTGVLVNLPQKEDMQSLSQTQNAHRAGKEKLQELGQSSSSHLDDFVKKQGKDIGKEVIKGQVVTSIDSMLLVPQPLETIIVVEEAVVVETLKPLLPLPRLSKKLVLDQLLIQDPDETAAGKQLETHVDEQVANNTKNGKFTLDDYGAINSEDELDPDNQSIDSDEDIEDTMQHTSQVLGSTFQDKCSDVQRMTEQQGLSPRGRKQTRHKPHQPLTNNSQIDMVRIQLQMDQAASNPTGKIWLFWSNETVQQCWEKRVTGNPMWRLHQKMKRVSATLSNWSKREYGDIFTKVREFEETIRQSEEELMNNNTEALRQTLHQMNATYIRYLKMEESILKQKTQLQWFKEGDANTKYFHALMRGDEQIAQAACDYYQQIFTGQNDRIDGRILQHIPTLVTPIQNEMLQAMPTLEELRQVVFAMNPSSAADMASSIPLEDLSKLPANWSEVVESIERCNQETRVTLVMWKTPPPNRYKLNTDGSALHNPGKIGGGGNLRDEQGIIIFAFAIPLGEGTNNQAEVVAPPWKIQVYIQDLQLLAKQCVFFSVFIRTAKLMLSKNALNRRKNSCSPEWPQSRREWCSDHRTRPNRRAIPTLINSIWALHQNHQGQITATMDDHISEERLEPVRITGLLNQENNQDRERTPNHMMEPMQPDQEQLSIKETVDVNGPRQMQGDGNAAPHHTQEAQHTITKAITRAPQEQQQGNGGKAVSKVKDKINSNENTMQQSKEYGGTQPTSTIKEAAGKSTNFSPNNYDHHFPPYNNSHSSQNVHEKGHPFMQNRAKEQPANNIQKGPDIDFSIPPPIKVSSNFDIHRSIHQINNKNSPRQTQNKTPVNNPSTRNVTHQIPDPAPPTVTQSLATRLRANQIKNDTPLDITSPIITTRQGYPSITFHEEDFMLKMPGRCKYTLVGKFSNAMPKIEVIRRSFMAQTQLTGGVKIVHFKSRNIYIDLDNEVDHISVWTKQRMFIAGHLMKLQVWTPTFKPAEETPIVPIWITLPELPWHCYYMDILTPLLSPIGKALYLDSAIMQKTRGSVAKGHKIGECPLKKRDEEIKKRKNEEAGKKGQKKQLNQTLKGNQQHEDNKAKTQSNRQTNKGGPAEEYTMQKEEQWQTQTKRKNKTQQQIQAPGKKQIPQVQVQVQQARTPHDQQAMQKIGMNSVTPVIEIEESGDQISAPPSPVIVVVKHCVDNEVPTPVTPLLWLMKLLEGGWM
ncbi:hypothetical protein MTR67_026212 [Solanum verrucosum]|uniref:DUF4283 domain-containing protein n=1 Tax=Solanum verrucosum TaxID=315347 RepID=A0AAF0TTQ9_SOLVR|nr:hypothetical protein MTR67_026212 [Solanum verrucosum]